MSPARCSSPSAWPCSAHAGLLTGGTAGVALLAHYATGIGFGPLFFVINLPFYALAWRAMGRTFTQKTFVAVVYRNPDAEYLYEGKFSPDNMRLLFQHTTGSFEAGLPEIDIATGTARQVSPVGNDVRFAGATYLDDTTALVITDKDSDFMYIARLNLQTQAVESLIEHTVRAGDVARLRLPGLSEERVPVFAGGLAILAEVLSAFEIKSLRAAEGALREGLLYDLVGRLTDEDARVRSVRAMQGRYHVDLAQAERVEATALEFLRQAADAWGLDEPLAELLLSWAARLHETGLDLSHSHYRRDQLASMPAALMPRT